MAWGWRLARRSQCGWGLTPDSPVGKKLRAKAASAKIGVEITTMWERKIPFWDPERLQKVVYTAMLHSLAFIFVDAYKLDMVTWIQSLMDSFVDLILTNAPPGDVDNSVFPWGSELLRTPCAKRAWRNQNDNQTLEYTLKNRCHFGAKSAGKKCW